MTGFALNVQNKEFIRTNMMPSFVWNATSGSNLLVVIQLVATVMADLGNPFD